MADKKPLVNYSGNIQEIGTNDTVPISNGGTGATTAAGALTNLGAAPSTHTHAATDVTSGTFATARIPDLDAAKITSGTFATARIGDTAITAAKINSDVAGSGLTKNATTGKLDVTAQLTDLGGTLTIAKGGTGATTAQQARTNLLPSQTGHSGKYLTTNGTDVSWSAVVESVDWTVSILLST